MRKRDPIKNIRQLLPDSSSYTREEIEDVVDQVLLMRYFIDENRENLIRRVEELYTIRQDDFKTIEKTDENLLRWRRSPDLCLILQECQHKSETCASEALTRYLPIRLDYLILPNQPTRKIRAGALIYPETQSIASPPTRLQKKLYIHQLP